MATATRRKKLNILNIIVFILCLLPIILINIIPRGNFIAGPVSTFIFAILLFVQMVLILISVNRSIRFIIIVLCINALAFIFMYWTLYGYIFKIT